MLGIYLVLLFYRTIDSGILNLTAGDYLLLATTIMSAVAGIFLLLAGIALWLDSRWWLRVAGTNPEIR